MSPERVHATALRMLNTYTTAKVAADMAGYHAADYPPGSPQYQKWRDVQAEIRRLAREGYKRG